MDINTKLKNEFLALGILAVIINTCLSVSASSSSTETSSTVATQPSTLQEDNTRTTHNCSAFCKCPIFNKSTDIPATSPLPRPCKSTDDCFSVENTTAKCRNSSENCSQDINNTSFCNTTTGLCQNPSEYKDTDCINLTNCLRTSNNTTFSCNDTTDACLNESEEEATPIDDVISCVNSVMENDEICNTTNGHCLYGCQSGYAKPTCKMTCEENCEECEITVRGGKTICTLCVGHFYKRGNNCVPCPDSCLQGGVGPTCRREDGECVYGCLAGHYGPFCSKACSLFCHPHECSRNDGCCLSGCRESKTCGCNCSSPCNPACRNNRCSLNCSCLEGCIEGFYGIYCGNRCGDNCVKSEIKGEFTCNQTTGHCLKGCVENTWWGDKCGNSCSSKCKNGTCKMENGTCMNGCSSGNWFGHDCSKQCNENCVDDICLQYTGECIRGCMKGWFGHDCSRKCNENCFNETCERGNGMCFFGCKDGYHDTNCSQACNERCKDNVCNYLDGNCTNGCVTGWKPPQCQESITHDIVLSSTNLGVNVGLGVGSLVLIGVTLAVMCGSRRRRRYSLRQGSRFLHHASRIISGEFTRKQKGDSEISPYGQVPFQLVPTTRIPVADIFDAVMKITVGELVEEFERLPAGFTKEFVAAKEVQNLTKNFYDVFPYDENRVVLKRPIKDGSDYINASHINGYKPGRRYIAAQGPFGITFPDFWTMVWQQDVSIIVMLICNQLEPYWPKLEAKVTYGDILITGTALESFADFVIRDFKLQYNDEERLVQQLQFTGWPECKRGVPPSAAEMIEFFHKYRAVLKTKEPEGPVLVHCNSGIGRTGVFLALDIATDDVLDTGSLDIFDTVRELRNQRSDMVQKKAQYQFLYEAVAQLMAFGCDLVPRKKQGVAFENRSKTIIKNRSQLRKLYTICNSSVALDEQDNVCISPRYSRISEDRPTSDAPEIGFVPGLLDVTNISAVYIDTYKEAEKIVATQMPSPETMDEFIQIVLQRDCAVILMLNIPDKDDVSVSRYWNTSSTYGTVKISHGKVQKYQSYKNRVLVFENKTNKDKKEKPTRHEVQFIQYQDWDDRAEAEILPTAQSLVKLVKTVRQAMAQVPGKRLLVHCFNGSDQTGLFCAVYNLMEKADLEEFINVVCTIRKVKARCPSALPTFHQFNLCHEVFIQYLEQMGLLACANVSRQDTIEYDVSDDENTKSASGPRDSNYITENPRYDPYALHDDEKPLSPAAGQRDSNYIPENPGYDPYALHDDEKRLQAPGPHDSNYITENPSYDPYALHDDEKPLSPASGPRDSYYISENSGYDPYALHDDEKPRQASSRDSNYNPENSLPARMPMLDGDYADVTFL